MSAKRRFLIACTLITAIYRFPAYSSLEYKGIFGSINAGYVGWNNRFVNTHRGEVWEVTADFGVNFKEAEFYSFYESNILNRTVTGRDHTISAMAHVKLFGSDMTFFNKIYDQWDNSWGGDPDAFYGFGYLDWDGEWDFFKPYIGLRDQSGDYISARYGQTNGWNGYIVGWTAVLPFASPDEKFILSNWNEIELGRNDAYTEQRFDRSGLNDGLAIVWKFYPRWKASVTWRYFDNKLGYDGFDDQMVYILDYDS